MRTVHGNSSDPLSLSRFLLFRRSNDSFSKTSRKKKRRRHLCRDLGYLLMRRTPQSYRAGLRVLAEKRREIPGESRREMFDERGINCSSRPVPLCRTRAAPDKVSRRRASSCHARGSSRLISSFRPLDKVHMKCNENVGCACIPPLQFRTNTLLLEGGREEREEKKKRKEGCKMNLNTLWRI